MRQGTDDRGRTTDAGWVLLFVVLWMMFCGRALGNRVVNVTVSVMGSGNPTECGYTVWVEWDVQNSGMFTGFDVEIWESGAPGSDPDTDYYPPSGSEIGSVGVDDYTAREASVEISDSSALSAGSHTIRAWVSRRGLTSPGKWGHSSECSLTVESCPDCESCGKGGVCRFAGCCVSCCATCCPAAGGDPVLMKTGEYRLYETDLSIAGRGLPINITRTYGSRTEHESIFGYGWYTNYSIKVMRLDDPDTIVFIDGQGWGYEYDKDVGDPNKFVRAETPRQYFKYDDGNDVFTLVVQEGMEYAFDANDNLASITDEHGNNIAFDYDANEALATITDDLGRDIDFTYDSNGLVETITDFAGRVWQYDYNDNNDLLMVTGPNTGEYPSGLTVTYYYTDHNLISIDDPNSDAVVYNYYDGQGRVWKQDVGDGSYVFDYDPTNSTATITSREDVNSKMVYGGSSELLEHTVYTKDPSAEPNSFTTTYAYNNDLHRVRDSYPAGNCIDYTYDSSGNITGIYYKTGASEPNDMNDANVIATQYTYDANFIHKVKTVKDALGNIATLDYNDTTGDLEKVTLPTVTTSEGNEAPTYSFTYNGYGQLETVTGADGIVTKYEYYSDSNDSNNYGRLHKMIADYNATDSNALNITMAFTYDALGRVVEVNDPNGKVAKGTYNDLDRLTEIIAPSPLSYVDKFSYDKNGNLSRAEREITGDANQVATLAYILQDKLKTITDPCSYVTSFTYNKNEDPNAVTDAEDNKTTCEYNERRLVSKVTDANGNITQFSDTVNGQVAEVNDPNNDVTKFVYDGWGRLIKISYPDDSNEQFSYDKNSNVVSRKTRKDETIYYEYDAMNRMVVKNRPGDPNIYFMYDVAGRLVDVNDGRTASNGGGITAFSFDRVGRVNEVNDTGSRIVKYEYDERSLRTKLVYPDDSNVTYEHDALGRLTKVKYEGATVAEYSYDELSRRTLVALGNDANAVYEYDLVNRLEKLTNNIDDTNSITYDYADYDQVGNWLSMKIDDANAHVYTYDELYRLTNVDYNDGNATIYTYDSLGNRTDVNDGSSTTYVRNRLNQYTSVGGTNYSYDDNGNLTDVGSISYYYDCESRMTSSRASGQPWTLYKYDFAGRRVTKATFGGSITKYCYDGAEVIAEYDNNDNLLRKFVYGPGIDEPICMIDVADNNAVYYYHFDGLGSVVALSDANGDVVETYSYDVFGEATIYDENGSEITDSNIGNPYMFTGRRYDAQSGLYYYWAGYYSPGIGRFLQPGPGGYEGGLNLYSYVGNNPTGWINPSGWINRLPLPTPPPSPGGPLALATPVPPGCGSGGQGSGGQGGGGQGGGGRRGRGGPPPPPPPLPMTEQEVREEMLVFYHKRLEGITHLSIDDWKYQDTKFYDMDPRQVLIFTGPYGERRFTAEEVNYIGIGESLRHLRLNPITIVLYPELWNLGYGHRATEGEIYWTRYGYDNYERVVPRRRWLGPRRTRSSRGRDY